MPPRQKQMHGRRRKNANIQACFKQRIETWSGPVYPTALLTALRRPD